MLSLLSSPKLFIASFRPAPFVFNYILEVVPGSDKFYTNSVINHNGKIAIVNQDLILSLDDRFYISAAGSSQLLNNDAPVQVIELISSAGAVPIPYAVLDLAYTPIGSANLYNNDKVNLRRPVFLLYINDNPVGYIPGLKVFGNKMEVDPSNLIRRSFSKFAPPVLGEDQNLFRTFKLGYGTGTVSAITKQHYATASVIAHGEPDCSNTDANWIDVLPIQERCKGTGNPLGGAASTSNTTQVERLKVDSNINSPTHNTTQWQVVRTDATACPVPGDTSPDWQPVISTVRCKELDSTTRETTERVAKVRDENPNSPYYQQYGIGVEATYGTSNIELATYYRYAGDLSGDASACPIAPPTQTGSITATEAQYMQQGSFGVLRVKFRRNGGTKFLSGQFGVFSGSQIGQSQNWFIEANQEYGLYSSSFGLEGNTSGNIQIVSVTTPGFSAIASYPMIEFVDQFTI